MLPSRGLSSSIPASVLRNVRSTQTQRGGASRNLSLWPFSKKQSSAEPQSASLTTSIEPSSESDAPAERLQDSFADTSASAPPHVSAPHPENPVDLSSTPYSKDSFTDLDLASILDVPERIGYLKALGLEYGPGPTACCEWAVEHLYVYTGMPWWATLLTLTVLWRAAVFLPTLNGSKHQALLQRLHKSPEFIEAKREFDEASLHTREPTAMLKARDKMSKIKKNSGASVTWSLVGILTVPFSIGMFRLFRAMAAIPVPSLETGGLAWFTDLTVHDPYFVLPLVSISLTALMFKHARAASPPATPLADKMSKGMMYILPPIIFLSTAWLPAGLQWFFLLLTAGSVVQTSATLNPTVRRWAGIPPLPRPSRPSMLAGAAGPTWQAPTSRNETQTGNLANTISELKDNAFGSAKKTESRKKAQEYEERRTMEEKEKAFRRMEDMRRKRAEKQQ
ncbi:hypothetical protein AAE478_005123 [Parahypoxylon ruwenzoriense]